MFDTLLMPSAGRLQKRMVCLLNSINVYIYLTTNPDTTSHLRRSSPRQWSKASSRQPLTSLKFLFLFLFRKTHSAFFHSENSTMILFFSLGVADEIILTGLDLHLHGNFSNYSFREYSRSKSWIKITNSSKCGLQNLSEYSSVPWWICSSKKNCSGKWFTFHGETDFWETLLAPIKLQVWFWKTSPNIRQCPGEFALPKKLF